MNILTFDVEEWFHLLDNNSTMFEKDWIKYEVRIYDNMNKIFNFLSLNELKATFFVVGWIAERYPDIVKKIDEYGHEIGSHTHYHQLIFNQTKSKFEYDIKKSIQTIEDIIGKKVKYFRAPGFSITEKNKWAFEVLYNNGITHDSSIFPASRSHGGMPNYSKSIPSKISMNNLEIKEFPINTFQIFGLNYVFSGGGYFRITPYFFIKKFSKNSNYIMTYFHPRDFDHLQPIIKDLSFFRKFKSYIGLKECLPKLDKWVNDFKFTDLGTADSMINWDKSPTVNL